MTKAAQTSRGKPKSPRIRKCLSCREWFKPKEKGITTCSETCAILYGRSNFTKQVTKEKRKEKRKLRDNDKSALMKDCQNLAQKIGRQHGVLSGITECVTCDVILSTQQQIDGGHFLPKNDYSAIKLYTLQIHPQCVKCNQYNSGMRAEYKVFMINRYGVAKTEWLESFKGVISKMYTIEYLRKYKLVMGKRSKILQRRIDA